jgi:hypothetical protein
VNPAYPAEVDQNATPASPIPFDGNGRPAGGTDEQGLLRFVP